VGDGRGAVRLRAAGTGGDDAEALVIEDARPGTDLLAAPDEEAFALLGTVARALHTAGWARPDLAVDTGALVVLRVSHPDLPTAGHRVRGRPAGPPARHHPVAGAVPRRPAPRPRAAVGVRGPS